MPIKFSRRFDKDYHKSPSKIRSKFQQRLALFLNNQQATPLNNHGLSGKWQGYRSINITGDWRAIFVKAEDDLVIFVALGTRG